MRALLQLSDGSKEELTLDDASIVGVVLLRRGDQHFVFDGYLGGYAHTALFTECPAPLILPELTPKPAQRRFLGQKPKDQNNG